MRKKNLQGLQYDTINTLNQYFKRCERTSVEVFSGTSNIENRAVINSICKWCNANKYRWKTVHSKRAFIKAIVSALFSDIPIYMILGREFIEDTNAMHMMEVIKSIYKVKQTIHKKWKKEQWIYNFKNIHFVLLYRTEKEEIKAERYGRRMQIGLDNLTSPVFGLMDRLRKTDFSIKPDMNTILSRLDALTNQLSQN